MNLLEQIKNANRIVNVLEPLREMFLNLEEAVVEEIPEEEIIKLSYEITNFIQSNEIAPEEELKALEMVGAANPMSILADWYEEAQYRNEVKEYVL